MNSDSSKPFEIIQQNKENRIIVRFAPSCIHDRTKEYEDTLARLVEEYDTIAFDLSQTHTVLTDWIRWIGRLNARAKKTGKILAVIWNDSVKEKADALDLKDKLFIAQSIEEVWKI